MKKKGFTLIEILLVVGIITIIAGLSVPFYRSFQVDQEMDIASKEILGTLRDAQNRSITGRDDITWGVHFDLSSNEYGIFQGTSFSSYSDDSYVVPNVIDMSTNFGDDVYFSKIIGAPSTAGIIFLEGDAGTTKQIEITTAGLISLD